MNIIVNITEYIYVICYKKCKEKHLLNFTLIVTKIISHKWHELANFINNLIYGVFVYMRKEKGYNNHIVYKKEMREV